MSLAINACSNDIWNVSDLIEWVRDEAEKQGCARNSVQLDDGYTTAAGKNDWHGSCVIQDTGQRVNFAINVDPVSTASSGS